MLVFGCGGKQPASLVNTVDFIRFNAELAAFFSRFFRVPYDRPHEWSDAMRGATKYFLFLVSQDALVRGVF